MGAAEPQAKQIITQSRLAMAGAFVFSVGILTFGEAYRTGHLVLGRYSSWAGGSVSFGYFAVALGLWFCAASLSQLVQPARLILDPLGLTYAGPWWQRQWRWADVGEFTVEEVLRGAKFIKFEVSGGPANALGALRGDPRATINGGWPLPLDQVCRELNAARIRWG